MKTYIVLIAILIFSAYSILGTRYYDKKRIEYFNEFNSVNIEGEIKEVHANSGLTMIYTVSGEKYVFQPYTSDLNGNNNFYSTAKQGDYVIKPAYSNTLKLITKHGTYKYTFRKNFTH